MEKDQSAPQPKVEATPKQSIASVANQVAMEKLRKENEELRKQQAQAQATPPTPFNAREELSKLNPKYLSFVGDELDKVSDPAARLKELKAKLPDLERASSFEVSPAFTAAQQLKKNFKPIREVTPFAKPLAALAEREKRQPGATEWFTHQVKGIVQRLEEIKSGRSAYGFTKLKLSSGQRFFEGGSKLKTKK